MAGVFFAPADIDVLWSPGLETTLDAVWTSVQEELRTQIGPQRFNLWFQNTALLESKDAGVRIGVPNLFIREWLAEHFREILARLFTPHLGQEPQIDFVIAGSLFQNARKIQVQAQADSLPDLARTQAGATGKTCGIRTDFTLDSFVVGPSNRLAHACALEVADPNSRAINPLFFHGSSGVGKTHLLQGILNILRRQEGPGKCCVEYLPAEVFTNQFIYAMRHNRLDGFRHKYRKVDVLLIDDVHFFCNKTGLQEEFLHTFDALDTSSKQVVLASDMHPKMMNQLKENLVSRFVSGMVVRLTPPGLDTRVAILKAKAAQRRKRIDPEVLRYVARRLTGNGRDLAGAVTTLVAYAALTRSRIDLSLAREALRELEHVPERIVDMTGIEKAIAAHFGASRSDLHSSRRTRAISFPRQVCMYLGRELTRLSCKEIANFFGSKHHTTVLNAQKRIAREMKKNKDLAELISSLREAARK